METVTPTVRTERPADYIDVSTLAPEPRKTARNAIRKTIGRFYGQPFTYRDVSEVLAKDPRYKSHHNIEGTVRTELIKMVKRGEIERVVHGKPLPGNPSIYRQVTDDAPDE